MRYIIYLRVSTDLQDVRTQEHHCINHLKGLTGEHFEYLIFTDEDVSARKTKLENRKGIQNALSILKPGDTFVAIALDRLGRSNLECAQIRDYVKKRKCSIILVNQPWILDNDILWGLMSGIASEEVKTLSKRTKDALAAKKSRGELIGTAPYGYKAIVTEQLTKKNKPLLKLSVDEIEIKNLEMMKNLSGSGYTLREIALELNNLGIVNRKGRPWSHVLVHEILKNHKQCIQVLSLNQIPLSV